MGDLGPSFHFRLTISPNPVQIQDPRQLPDSVCRAAAPSLPSGVLGPCEYQYDLRGQSPAGGMLGAKDELVFLAGSAGDCDVASTSWAGSQFEGIRFRINLRDFDPGDTSLDEAGCVFLYHRTSGAASTLPDLVDYDESGDGTSHKGGCIPTSAACGAIKAYSYDVDGDGTPDFVPYRWDFLGQWAVDKWFIGETDVDGSEDVVDLVKWRIDNPAETEGVWDLRDGTGACAAFLGYIDGPVRVVRVIQGAASGVGTTKYEFAYPGEIRQRVNLRVHNVGGPLYMYADLMQADVSPAGNSAKIYKAGHVSTPFDVIDGQNPSSPTFAQTDWYQMSSVKGSFLLLPEEWCFPTAASSGGAYDDTTTPLWKDTAKAVEYNEEVGDRGAARWTVTDVCDTQYFDQCYSDRAFPGEDQDPRLGIDEHTWVMLDAGNAAGTVGQAEVDRRDRGVFSTSVKRQVRDIGGGGSVNLLCLLVLYADYGNDGGPVDTHVGFDGCSGVAGWNLYESRGLGHYRRLASLPVGVEHRDTTLRLDEQRTYYAALVGEDGSEGALSQGVTVVHSDTTAPGAPQNVTASYDSGFISISWDAPVDADVARFKVLASGTSGGPYTTADPGNDSHCASTSSIPAGSGTYYLIVVAVDSSGNESVASNEVVVEVP